MTEPIKSRLQPLVRKAGRADVELVAQILGEAFRRDAVMTYLSPNWPEFTTCLYYSMVRRFFLKHHHVYVTADGSGAALWLPPGVTFKSYPFWGKLDTLWIFLSKVGYQGYRRLQALARYSEAYHPAEPHFYLNSIGVRPNKAGRGIGSALLQEVLSRCDREGIPAYLENTNSRNLPLYERFGFQVTTQGRLPHGGPPIWFMLRPPSTTSDQQFALHGQDLGAAHRASQ
ncbi:MAG: GNAT family N-acetyltransferase [Deltaproteobacteria bacterium]|nr:GNAT family N-acetyltransferase [Deltaproteobacteria bacterium]